MSHSTPSSNSPIELKVTIEILSEIQGKVKELGPVKAAINVLEKHLGNQIEAAINNPDKVKERAVHIFPTLATSIGDRFFTERVVCKAIEAVSHSGTNANFRLTFPYIDSLISS